MEAALALLDGQEPTAHNKSQFLTKRTMSAPPTATVTVFAVLAAVFASLVILERIAPLIIPAPVKCHALDAEFVKLMEFVCATPPTWDLIAVAQPLLHHAPLIATVMVCATVGSARVLLAGAAIHALC